MLLVCIDVMVECFIVFFKHKTAYEVRISDWSSDVCSSDLRRHRLGGRQSDALAWPARSAGAGAAGISSGVGLRRVDLRTLVADLRGNRRSIGRESCRERVCQYV